jgi:glutamate--cysteine ligase
MSTKEVSDRVDPVITTREQLIAPMARAKAARALAHRDRA